MRLTVDIKIKNPRLKKLIAFRRLDRQTLIALADKYCFPVQLIDSMCGFLETKLLEILISHGSNPLANQLDTIYCNSTDELRVLLRTKPSNPIYFTDRFMLEYFDRVESGMSERQSKFYDKLLKKIGYEL